MAADKTAKTLLGGKRKLTLIDTIAQSVGLMGPVFSIAFLVPLLVGIGSASGNGAGAAAPLTGSGPTDTVRDALRGVQQ